MVQISQRYLKKNVGRQITQVDTMIASKKPIKITVEVGRPGLVSDPQIGRGPKKKT